MNLSKHGRLAYLLKLLGVVALYTLLAKMAQLYLSANGIVSILWFPSGLVLGVLLIGGRRYVPSVFLGVFLVNAMGNLSLGASATIAVGSTLAPLLGAWLLTRNGQIDLGLQSLRDYLRLVVLAGFFACCLSALNGVTVLLLSGFLTTETYFQNLLDWWMGDVLGILLVTPLLLVWQRLPKDWVLQKRVAEAALVLGLALLFGQMIFLDWFHHAVGKVALGYWMFLFVIWAAVRLGVHGVVALLAVIAVQALLGAVHGIGFFAHDMAQFGLLNYWLYMLVLSVTGMMLATYVEERKAIDAALSKSELRFRALFEQGADPVWLVDSQTGILMDFNTAAHESLGYTREEFTQLPIAEIEATESQQEIAIHIKKVMEEGRDVFETAHRNKRGEIRHILASVNKVVAGGQIYLQSVLHDITERKQDEEELQLRAKLLDSVSDTIFLLDLDAKFVYLNEAAWKTRGYTQEEMMGINLRVLDTPKYEKLVGTRFREIMEKGQCIFESEHRCKDGTVMPVEINARLIDLSGHKRLLSIIRDITWRKQAEQELLVTATAFDTSYEAMVITDAGRCILKVNRAFTRITGYSAKEVLGKNPSILKSGRHDSLFYLDMWERLNRDKFWEGEIWNRRKNGGIYPEWESIAAVSDDEGNVTHYIAAFSDISKRKEAEAQIYDLAFYDPLTKLPNRRLLQDRLRQAIYANARNERQGALLFIDLDNFKQLNDTHGHTVGDRMLSEAANRLRACIREGDTAARLGGDEFVVLLEDLDADDKVAVVQAETAGEKIREVLWQPYLIDERKHHSSASIGITLFRGPAITIEEMFKRADAAMYQAKAGGRNTLHFFDADLQAAAVVRIAMETDLRQAISEQGQFQLYYQAQVDSAGHMTGAEALLRWQRPERGTVSPAEFIPLAEESGLILPLGHWVLASACMQLAAWAAQAETARLTLSVNISAKQFHQAAFVEEVLALVEAYGVNTGNLKLEITEGLMLDNVDGIIAKMAALEARGISFSMDDFGTGYSSLSYLKRLPLQQLKIDQSFVRDVITDPDDAAIARTIIALARSMDMEVIAEGVETEAQREFLERNGCHAFQGYLFSKPVPIKEFEQLITRYPVL